MAQCEGTVKRQESTQNLLQGSLSLPYNVRAFSNPNNKGGVTVMVEKRHSYRLTYTRRAAPLIAGLLVVLGSCLTATARSEESRIPGQVLQKGGAPFTDTVRQMELRDIQLRREIAAGLRPDLAQAGVSYHVWRSGDSRPDGTVFTPSAVAPGGVYGKLSGPGGDAPQGIGTNFAGIVQQDQINEFGGSFWPPDTMGAVGPGHFVQMLRGSVAIFDKSGNRLSHVTLNSFFTTGSYPRGNCFSPRVIYDRRSGRWFAIALETNAGANNHIILAVSDTSNPTGTWRKYAIAIGEANTWTDEAMLGTDDNGVYFGATMVPSGGSPFGKIAATRKASLLASSPSLGTVYSWRLITDMKATPCPVHNQDAVASDGFMFFLASAPTGFADLRYRSLQWALSGVPTLSLTANVSTAAYGAPVNAPQPDGAANIDVGDDRILMAVRRAGQIWTTRNVGVTATGGAGAVDRTAVEWLQLTPSASLLTLAQQGRIYDGATENPMFYYYGSIMVSGQGHVAVGFSGSSATTYVGAYTCGRLAGDPAGTMRAVAQIKEGEAPYERLVGGRNRWGNYSYTSLDPNDDMSMWTVQQFADSTDDNPTNVWGTWIARLLAPAPTITAASGSAVQGTTGVVLNVTGTGFYDPGPGYANRLAITLSGDGISNYVVTYNSPTSASVRFDVDLDATIGPRDVIVTNPDGQQATLAGAFEVVRAIPTTLTVEDVAGVIGQTVNLTATLKNADDDTPLEGKTINFFVDGQAVGSAVTNASGVAVLPIAIPEGFPIGEHVILARFNFDGTHRPSEGTATGTVSKADTTVTADDKTGKIGATASLTAKLTRNHDGANIVGRTIDFTVDGTGVGSGVTNASGVASADYVIPEGAGVGARVIGAAFAGDGSYNPSNDEATLTVEKGETAVAVADVEGTVGETIDLMATLTVVGAGWPLEGKDIAFSIDGTGVGTAVTNATGVATFGYLIPNAIAVGDHAIGAAFAGDDNYEASNGTGTLNVNANTTLVAQDVAGTIGSSVALSATLTRSDMGDLLVGKSVQFSVAGTVVGSGVTNSLGVASVNYVIPEGPGAGDRQITADFAGDDDYNASTDDATLTVQPTPTRVFVQDRTGTIGANVELRAHLFRTTDNGPIQGRTINFSIDGTNVGSGVTAGDGRATYLWRVEEGAGAGTRTITGSFDGDGTYLASSNNGNLTVNKANTVLTGVDRTGTPGAFVQLRAYLRRSTDLAWVVGRTITFFVDGTPVGTGVTNTSGMAARDYTIAQAPGQYPIGYEFAGDAAYNPSTGGSTLTVTDTTSLAVDDKSGQIGATVPLTATLTRNFDNAPLEGKAVDFKVDGTAVGSGTTNAAGVASVDYVIPVGSGLAARTIEGNFAGDVVYAASSDTGTLTVEKADTTTTVADTSGPIHSTVQLSATVTRNSDGGPVPGMEVAFSVDGTGVGSGNTDDSGVASVEYVIPENGGAGERVIEAVAAGDDEHNGSSDTGTLTVEKANTTLTVNSPTGTAGESVTFSGTLVANPPVAGRQVDVSVDGTVVGTGVTDDAGAYSVEYAIPASAAVGAHAVQASFAGDAAYSPSSAEGTLTVMSNTTLAVASVSGKPGETVALAATLTANNTGLPLEGRNIVFAVDGTDVGSANTNGSGVAEVNYFIDEGPASRTVSANFAGDADYHGSTGEGTLTVEKANTTLWTIDRTAAASEQVIFRQYDLRRTTDNMLLAGKRIYYYVEGTLIGSSLTNDSGDSALGWIVSDGSTSRSFTVEFQGDDIYNGSTASGTLTVPVLGTKMVTFDRTQRIAARTELRARLLKGDNSPLVGRQINFYVDGTFVITRPTDAAGDARYPFYTVPDGAGAGDRVILSEFIGNVSYPSIARTATLRVLPARPYIWVASRSVKAGALANLYALFRRVEDMKAQTGKDVSFLVDGTKVADVTTNEAGVARYFYDTTGLAEGAHTVRCEFAGDAWLEAGFGEGLLTIVP